MKGRPLRGGDWHIPSIAQPRVSLDEGPPAQGRRRLRLSYAESSLENRRPLSGAATVLRGGDVVSLATSSAASMKGRPAQGRRPGPTREMTLRLPRPASMKGRPVRGGDRVPILRFPTWPFGCWPRRLPGTAADFASQPGRASWACHLPVVPCAKAARFRRADGGFAASFIGVSSGSPPPRSSVTCRPAAGPARRSGPAVPERYHFRIFGQGNGSRRRFRARRASAVRR